MFAAAILAFAHADSNFFAPAPAYNPAMTYGQMQAAYSPAFAPLEAAEALTYVQPVEYAYPAEESEGSALFYATGALLVGAVAVVASRRQEKTSVAEPDLEAATGAVRVAMLFSSGRGGNKKAAKGKKPAARGGKKGGRAAPPADDNDLFVHEGTKGFTGDEAAFVYRAGLAQ
jgi:hypothetical protein